MNAVNAGGADPNARGRTLRLRAALCWGCWLIYYALPDRKFSLSSCTRKFLLSIDTRNRSACVWRSTQATLGGVVEHNAVIGHLAADSREHDLRAGSPAPLADRPLRDPRRLPDQHGREPVEET